MSETKEGFDLSEWKLIWGERIFHSRNPHQWIILGFDHQTVLDGVIEDVSEVLEEIDLVAGNVVAKRFLPREGWSLVVRSVCGVESLVKRFNIVNVVLLIFQRAT